MDFITTGARQADIIFGNPRRDCAGQGICKVTSPQSAAGCPCLSTRAWIKNDSKAQHLSFYFSKDLLSAPIREAYFDSNFFIVEEELKVDLKLLGLEGGIIQLRKGLYNISQSDDQQSLIISIAYKSYSLNQLIQVSKRDAEEYPTIN